MRNWTLLRILFEFKPHAMGKQAESFQLNIAAMEKDVFCPLLNASHYRKITLSVFA